MGITSQYTKDEKRILFFVALVWGADMLYYLKAVVMRLPIINLLSNFFIPSVVIISLLVTFSSLSKRIKVADFVFYFVCIAIYLLNFVFYPANFEWLTFFLPSVFFQVLPYFFIGLLITSQKHIKVIETVSIAYVVFSLIYLYFTMASRTFEGEEMGAAYSLLPHLLIVLVACFRRFKWYYLVVFILGLLRLMGTGNRGTLLCLALFLILYLLFCVKSKYKFWLVGLLALMVVYIGYRQELFFGSLGEFMGGQGFNTRVFDMTLNNEFYDSNGRDDLASFFMSKINMGGFFGYGIFGDRTLLHDEHGYPHNLLLELWVDFGMLVGSILFLVVLWLVYKAFRSCNTKESMSFLLVFVIVGFFSLFLSNTYLSNPMFFLMIGYCIRTIRDQKATNKYNNIPSISAHENLVSKY